MDSEDEDDFVSIGKPLTPIEGDIKRKAPQVQDETVRDDRGRQRFHGAFTGGFSAGYFNTVGSKEGWTPSTFVSAREKGNKFEQRPEDFMDDEDLGMHGIAPRQVTTTTNFTSQEQKRKRPLVPSSVIPGEPVLEDLIVPHRLPIAVTLLTKMGWKQGQGIGPRVKSRPDKVYGCWLPPGGAKEPDVNMDSISFAPKDVSPFSFEPKDDLHGIGYRGLDPRSALKSGQGHINLFDPPQEVSVSRTGKRGMLGTAFGVGALEEEDDYDVYKTDSMANYDRVLETERDNKYGWTAPKNKGGVTSTAGYIGTVLEGFTLSEKPLKTKTIFPAPQLPQNYKPFHVFPKPVFLKPSDGPERSQHKKLDASERSAILGEVPVVGSVFNLIGDKDKMQMDQAKKTAPQSTTKNEAQRLSKSPEKTATSAPLQPGPGGSFLPFLNDEAKQTRYKKFLELRKHGNKEPYSAVAEETMTEWEREREREEFIRSADLYRPLSSMIASRFTRAKFSDDTDKVDLPAEEGGDKNDQEKAASLKMFGKLTRDVFEWHPHRLLCKRFNIPDPYPDSTVVGLPTVKKDKYSIFNFLSVPHHEPQSMQQEEVKEVKAIEFKDKRKQKVQRPNIFEPPPGKAAILRKNEAEKNHEAAQEIKESIKEDKTEKKSLQEQIADKVSQGARPPVDLFKAIFSDTDSSSSDSDTGDDKLDEDMEELKEKRDPIISGESSEMKKMDTEEPGDMNSRAEDSVDHSTIRVQSISERLSLAPSGDEESDDDFGPSLPPPLLTGTNPEVIDLTNEKKDNTLKHKKHKQKEKKKKKKYRKEKKSKKRKYKSKKETVRKAVDSTSASTASDNSDNGDIELTSDKDLINRIQSMSGKRKSAADYM